jgi:hypothetical protein
VLDGVGMVQAWPLVGAFLPFCSAVATSEAPCRCLFLFFLPERFEVPSPVPLSRLALPRERSKIAPTASSPEVWLVAMSRSSLVVCGPLHPSLWTRDSQVVPDRNGPKTSSLATSGSSLHCLEKRRMYSRRVSPDFCQQFFRSQGFPRCV